MNEERPRPDETESFVETAGARLAVFSLGSGAKTVVLLHGGPGVPDYLSDVAVLLADTHRVVRFDQRGTGRSACRSGRYALANYVQDLDAVRRALGLDRLALFGHSWGGTVAQLYAACHPDRMERLCLCSSGIGVGDDWRAMEKAVMAYNRRRGGLAGFLRLGLDQAIAMVPGAIGDHAAARMMARVWRHYFDPPTSAPASSPEWLAGVRSEPIFATRRAALEADAGQLGTFESCPVLILYGEHDIYGTTTERVIARHPGARVVVIPGAGHIAWLQRPAAFAAEVRTFFT